MLQLSSDDTTGLETMTMTMETILVKAKIDQLVCAKYIINFSQNKSFDTLIISLGIIIKSVFEETLAEIV